MKRRYTPRGTPVAERFWSRVERGADSDCWLWTASQNDHGYGLFKLDARAMNASRAAYILTHGEIAPGLCVLHRCDNPPCVNPAHLFLGTHQDNMRDCAMKGRAAGGEKAGKLSIAQRADIKQRRPTETLGRLAREFGVSRTAVLKIANGQTRAS